MKKSPDDSGLFAPQQAADRLFGQPSGARRSDQMAILAISL
jgi:hypothetical protein